MGRKKRRRREKLEEEEVDFIRRTCDFINRGRPARAVSFTPAIVGGCCVLFSPNSFILLKILFVLQCQFYILLFPVIDYSMVELAGPGALAAGSRRSSAYRKQLPRQLPDKGIENLSLNN